jgi:hypothetical protein
LRGEEAQGFPDHQWWVVLELPLSDATAATAATATPMVTMAATDKPALGAAATAGVSTGAGVGAGVSAVAGADWAKAWPVTRLMIAIAEKNFFIAYPFTLEWVILERDPCYTIDTACG